jgi:hypothetical protein
VYEILLYYLADTTKTRCEKNKDFAHYQSI